MEHRFTSSGGNVDTINGDVTMQEVSGISTSTVANYNILGNNNNGTGMIDLMTPNNARMDDDDQTSSKTNGDDNALDHVENDEKDIVDNTATTDTTTTTRNIGQHFADLVGRNHRPSRMAQIRKNPIPLLPKVASSSSTRRGPNGGGGGGAGGEAARQRERRRIVRFADRVLFSNGDGRRIKLATAEEGGSIVPSFQCYYVDEDDDDDYDYDDNVMGNRAMTDNYNKEVDGVTDDSNTMKDDSDNDGERHRVSPIIGEREREGGIVEDDKDSNDNDNEDEEVITPEARGIGEFVTHDTSATIDEDGCYVIENDDEAPEVIEELDPEDEEFVEDILWRYRQRKRRERDLRKQQKRQHQSGLKKKKQKKKKAGNGDEEKKEEDGIEAEEGQEMEEADADDDDSSSFLSSSEEEDEAMKLMHAVEEELAEEQPWEEYLKTDIEMAEQAKEQARQMECFKEFQKARVGWEIDIECEAFARRLIRHTDAYNLHLKRKRGGSGTGAVTKTKKSKEEKARLKEEKKQQKKAAAAAAAASSSTTTKGSPSSSKSKAAAAAAAEAADSSSSSSSSEDSEGDEEEERRKFLANEPEILKLNGHFIPKRRSTTTTTTNTTTSSSLGRGRGIGPMTPGVAKNDWWRSKLPPNLHEIEQSCWESKIVWDGDVSSTTKTTTKNSYSPHTQHSNYFSMLDDNVAAAASSSGAPPTDGLGLTDSNVVVKNLDTDMGWRTTSGGETSGPTPTTPGGGGMDHDDVNVLGDDSGNGMFSTRGGIDVGRIGANVAEQLLNRPMNEEFETMDFSAAMHWDITDEEAAQMDIPLVLNKGLAGTSVARMMAPTSAAHTRPLPLSQSDVYMQRMKRELKKQQATGSAASGGGTDPSKEEDLERFIAQKQKKRERMALDKTKRVLDAMGTMDIGGGQGRTITSSLMGPGGTERTGRPSKGVVGASSLAYDAQHVEHLELVYNHHMVKPDFKRSELRHYHRPRLTRTLVQGDHYGRKNSVVSNIVWQLQIRLDDGTGTFKSSKSKNPHSQDGSTVVTNALVGTHPGALSQTRLKNETDLTPSEGHLVVLEYSEERPPIVLGKGFSCKIVNYYRGDKKKCPISVGGGDRPPKMKRSSEAAAAAVAAGGATGAASSKAASGLIEGKPKLEAPMDYTLESVTEFIGAKKIIEQQLAKKQQQSNTKGDGNAASNGQMVPGSTNSNQPPPPTKKKEQIEILPEGVTEILLPKVHGPFIGSVDEGTVQSGVISNLFVAPIFKHNPFPTDFLLIFGKKPRPLPTSIDGTNRTTYGVCIRDMPSSIYCCGQTEPRVRVYAPNTTGEKNFLAPFQTYQIAKYLTRTESLEGQGLRFDEISDRLFTNTRILQNALRQRIKQVAVYDKNTQIWTSKRIGFEEYPGVEALGRRFSPESVQAYESSCACVQRLADLGIMDIYNGNSVQVVGQALMFVNGAVSAARERKSKMRKMADNAKALEQKAATALSKKKDDVLTLAGGEVEALVADEGYQAAQQAWLAASTTATLYEDAAQKLEHKWKEYKFKQEVARFIYAELVLAPWHLTQEFIEVHKHAQGSGMMKLSGIGDPSGRLEGFNFMREADLKPSKQAAMAAASHSEGALNAQIKKITGTENDLRKLTMKEMASLLRSYGMQDKQIATLKRWDRVHCIRDLSTKAASDGMGDGMERYARGEKLKLADQKQMYRDRIQEIWRRQRAALMSSDLAGSAAGAGSPGSGIDPLTGEAEKKRRSSIDGADEDDENGPEGNKDGTDGTSADGTKKDDTSAQTSNDKKDPSAPAGPGGSGPGSTTTPTTNMDDDDSDSEDDDDLVDMLEEGMMDGREANRIMAEQDTVAGVVDAESGAALRDEARELAAFLRQKEEERNATQGLSMLDSTAAQHKRQMEDFMNMRNMKGRKCIRRRITKTHPDGTQVTTFQFVMDPNEVEKVTVKKKQKEEEEGKSSGSGGVLGTLTTKGSGSSLSSKNKQPVTTTIIGDLVGGKSMAMLNASPTKKGKGRGGGTTGPRKDKIKPGLKTKSEHIVDALQITHAMYEEDAEEVAKPSIKLSAKAARAAAAAASAKEEMPIPTTSAGNDDASALTPMSSPSSSKRGPKGNKDKISPKKYKSALTKLQREQEKAEKKKEKMLKKKRQKRLEEEAEAADLYSAAPHRRKSGGGGGGSVSGSVGGGGNGGGSVSTATSRRERGSIRERKPHVMLSDRLETIREQVENRPNSGPFRRPVSRRAYPQYYDLISSPIDLQTIRDKNKRYEYKKADTFLEEFALMRDNAIKFNGEGSALGNEASAIYNFVKTAIDSNREEWNQLEEAVRIQKLNSGKGKGSGKRGRSSSSKHKHAAVPKEEKATLSTDASSSVAVASGGTSAAAATSSSSTSNNVASLMVDGVETTVQLGNLDFAFDGTDSDEDSTDAALKLAA